MGRVELGRAVLGGNVAGRAVVVSKIVKHGSTSKFARVCSPGRLIGRVPAGAVGG